MIDTVLQDLRYALRTLLKNPGYASVAVLVLALGIGVNTAVFSVLNGVVLRPLRYGAADRLYTVFERNERGDYRLASYPTFIDWRQQTDVFDGLAYVRGRTTSLRGHDGVARVLGAFVSDGFFDIVEGRPQLGRTFSADEEQPGGLAVAVLTDVLWRRHFGSDPAALGSTIALDEGSYQVIGILPPWFRYPDWADVYLPLATIVANEPALTQRGIHADSRTVARLKSGLSVSEAHAAMAPLQTRLAADHPRENAGWTNVELVSVVEEVLGFGAVRPVLLMLGGAVILVLLLACANVASMSLVRAAKRSRELAVRSALGAGRARLTRLLLTETAVIVIIGGSLGVLFAWWGLGLLRGAVPDGLPRIEEIALDWRVLGFTALISLVTTVLVGVAPALRAVAPPLAESLKEGAFGAGAGLARSRLRASLVTLEVALAFVLLSGAGLLIRSFWLLNSLNPGFNPLRVVTLDVFPPGTRYETPERAIGLYERLAAEVAALPGVGRVALSNHVPLSGAWLPSRVEVPGHTPAPGQDESVLFRTVSSDYFETMQIPLRRGIAFTPADVASAARVAIVNETLARRYWGADDPVGRSITLFKSAQNRPDFGERFAVHIIGVVADVRHAGLEEEPAPEVYIPYTVNPWGHMVLVVRTVGDPEAMIPILRRAVARVEPETPVATGTRAGGFLTMEQFVSTQLARRRFTVTLLAGFAIGALLLAALGIYGLIAYVVTLRTRELGIRAAMGANRLAIVRLVMAESSRLVGLGLAVGLAGALGLMRLISNLLYGIGPADAPTFVSMMLFLAAVALLASWLPARRAARVDPMVALRAE